MEPSGLDRQYRRQAAWFAGERNRLLRKADIASRRCVLDLGAGTGVTLRDLAWRCAGLTVGLDCDVKSLQLAEGMRVAGHADQLPFSSATFDLVFTQMFFLWVKKVDQTISEIVRILKPEGQLVVAAEPDYGGLIEYPPGRTELKAYGESLVSEGADSSIGRKLGGALQAAGFEVISGVHPCDPLAGASRSNEIDGSLSAKQTAFAFLPYFYFLCRKRL